MPSQARPPTCFTTLLVLLAERDLPPVDVIDTLRDRHRASGRS